MKTTWLRLLGAFALAIVGWTAMVSTASAQTPLTACGSLTTGNYVVTKNITASGDCFVITADSVAIDFKGHTLTGNGTGSGIADSGSHDFAAITNGKIKKFGTGIFLGGCCHGINKMDVSGNAGEGIDIESCCTVLNDVKTNDNGGDGIDIDSDDNVMTWVSAQHNGGGGIFNGGCCDFVDHARVTNNAGIGIELLGCCSSVVDSRVTQNGGDGVNMTSCCNAVTSSTVSKNTGNGVTLPNSCCNYVTESKINRNGGIGVEFPSASGDQVLIKSTANGNSTGVAVFCPSVIIGLKANHNSTANLTETGGTCTNLRNKVQ